MRNKASDPDDDEQRLDDQIADFKRRLKELGGEDVARIEENSQSKVAKKAEEKDDELDPPPSIDPARLEAIPEVKSLKEGLELMDAIYRNIQLVEGREELAQRARQLELLKLANGAPRCRHFKLDGTGCGSPALRGQDYCHYHHQLHSDSVDFRLLIEDWDSLHVAHERLARDIQRGAIADSKARLLIQILQSLAKNIQAKNVLKNREMDEQLSPETVAGDRSKIAGD